MAETTAVHDTIRTTRVLRAAPEAVFGAWADPDTHRHWQPAPEGMRYEYDRHDFTEGGVEHCALMQGDQVFARFVNRYIAIETNRRIIFSVRAELPDGSVASVSQHTIEVTPEGEGSRLVCTEQVAWTGGVSRRSGHEAGWATLLDRLVAWLDGPDAAPADRDG